MADIGPETIALASKLAGDVKQLKRRQRDQARANGSSRRSVTGALPIRDEDGNTRVKVGAQADGTITVQEFGGEPLAQPSTPIVEERDGALVVTFDGFDVADLASYATRADFSHVGVHVSTEEGFSLTDDEPLARLTNPGGESATLALPGGTMFYLKLVAYTRSGVASLASVEVSGTPYSPGTIPPASSPPVTVTGTVDSLIVEAGRVLTPGNRLQWHISTDPGFDPKVTGTLTQYGPETAQTMTVISTTASGAPLNPAAVYAVRALEVNDAGVAPSAGGPQFGQLNPMKTFRDFVVEGVSNYINGLLTLRSGVGDPQERVNVSSTYQKVTTSAGYNPRGLSRLSNGAWVTVDYIQNNGSVLYRSSVTGQNEGAFGTMAGWLPVGGLVVIGSNVYILCGQAVNNGWDYSRTVWRVLIYTTAGAYVGYHTPSGIDTTGSSSRPMIGHVAGGSKYVIGFVKGSTLIAREFAAADGAALAQWTLSSSWGGADVCGIAREVVPTPTGAPGASARIAVASPTAVSVWRPGTNATTDPTSRIAAEDWAPGGTATRGIYRDPTTGLWYSSDATNVYTHTNNSGAQVFAHTWADTDPGGDGFAETRPGPTYSTIPRRMARWVVTLPDAPPDDGTVDGANAAYVYVGPTASTLVRQDVALTDGATALVLDQVATAGAAPPAVSGFAARISTAIGRITGGGGLIDLKGDGSWALGPLRGSTDGTLDNLHENQGSFTATTDAGGRINIPHGLGSIPSWASAQATNTNHYAAPGPLTSVYASSTHMACYVVTLSSGATLANTSVTVLWSAKK